jgi:hypothetical protein
MKFELPFMNGLLPTKVVIPDAALVVYVCPECDFIRDRPIVATSPHNDELSLRAHRDILQGHVRSYREPHKILVIDALGGGIIDTIPKTPRLH